jgi:hypothetical protein
VKLTKGEAIKAALEILRREREDWDYVSILDRDRVQVGWVNDSPPKLVFVKAQEVELK